MFALVMENKTDGRVNNGGKRANSGPKKKYVPMEVRLPSEDKIAVNGKFGRSFNQIFRAWVKTIIK